MNNLTDCKSCGHQIAKTAKVCPVCGAKNKYTAPGAQLAAIVLIGGVMLYSWIGDMIPENKPPLTAAEQQVRAERQAERDANRARRNKEADAIFACQRLLERSLHNPDSLKWDSMLQRKVTHLGAGGVRVSHGYSAENLLGGRRRGAITCEFDKNNRLIDHAIAQR